MKLIVANWKMHKTRAEARAFAADLGARIGSGIADRELVVAPPWTALDAARDEKARWSLACQNVAAEADGAFTGEVSAAMAADAGCRYAIVGHSERRRLFGEDGATLEKKIARCREADLTPIYCIGESAEQRDAGRTEATLAAQIATLSGDPADAPLVLAYEPIWAIGTGRNASPADAGQVIGLIRETVGAAAGPDAAAGVRIQYGGSVKAANIRDFMAHPDIDGALVGGASLDPEEFALIVKYPS